LRRRNGAGDHFALQELSLSDVRFGSLADMVARIAMSAVTPKADFGAAATSLFFVPQADIDRPLLNHLVGAVRALR